MPVSLRHFQSPRVTGRVSVCHIKIGSLFLTLIQSYRDTKDTTKVAG